MALKLAHPVRARLLEPRMTDVMRTARFEWHTVAMRVSKTSLALRHPRAVSRIWVLGVAVVVAAAGCSKKSTDQSNAAATTKPAPPPPPPPPDPVADARNLFNTKCVVCHGDHGAGDGPGAAALNPKPRAFADPAWQASVTDEQLKKTIVEGGAGVGKSVAMSPNPELKDKPEELNALVKIVRDFKRP
jgi:mono/diheme cytochrome c family protein